MTVAPLGDSAVVVTLGDTIDPVSTGRAQALAAELRRLPLPGVVDVVPAFGSVALFYETGRVPEVAVLQAELEGIAADAGEEAAMAPGRVVEIPVCYGGDHGPDLAGVAARAGLAPAEVSARHAAAEYFVHAIGFAPGFPYLGGLPPELATPRRATPRVRVPAGSVGIGGAQTGVYPLSTSGGWNLIGRTPLALFDAAREEPALLRSGDRVRFRAIAESAFAPLAVPSVRGEAGPASGIEILRPGMFTSVQDLGRVGWRAQGVPLSGAADPFALRVANLLVGNDERAAGLEFALVGPELRFARDTVVAVGGAECAGLASWRPVRVVAGVTLKLGAVQAGCRSCLAVAGGIGVTPVMGSRSTCVSAGFGGWQGRWLQEGDVLPMAERAPALRGRWHLDRRILPGYSARPCVRVVRGRHAGEFRAGWLEAAYTVSRQSDRMGLRLEGPPLRREAGPELVSLPVAPGTVQVPPDGRPIVLLAEAQTIGGYPQIAHVATVDLPLVAQLRAGDAVQFREIPLAEAWALAAAREHSLALLREGLKEKWR